MKLIENYDIYNNTKTPIQRLYSMSRELKRPPHCLLNTSRSPLLEDQAIAANGTSAGRQTFLPILPSTRSRISLVGMTRQARILPACSSSTLT
jgi:hypothetical protein